ncbi:MAG: cysteine lyase, partial [Mastigocladus sp. ERB_26_1]
HQQWGTAQERYEQICHHSEYLWRRLAALPNVIPLRTSPPESGLVSFQLTQKTPQAHRELVEFLQSKRIFTRTIADPSCIRACVHYFTLNLEIDQLIEGIEEWLVVSC